ncbi:MAG: type II toxin-antitoxin system VapC family toxin [Rugosibacter sp.]|nr:type II toxin-antitoxin system VapC family toxin [Rugosibacter sp.]
MLVLDTNVLVQILIDDPRAVGQCAAARALASAAGEVYVPQVVQIETVWVLESAYGFARAELAAVLETLLGNQSFVLQHADVLRTALGEFRNGAADFSDYVILAQARAENMTLATFDRKLGKLPGAQLVSGK